MKAHILKTLLKVSAFCYVAARTGSLVYAANQEGGNSGNSSLMNPLNAADITEFITKILDVLLTFALPIIIFFIMYGGFKLVTARGQAEQISEGRSAITWAVIGGVIVLGAKIIIEVIKGTVAGLSA